MNENLLRELFRWSAENVMPTPHWDSRVKAPTFAWGGCNGKEKYLLVCFFHDEGVTVFTSWGSPRERRHDTITSPTELTTLLDWVAGKGEANHEGN